MTVDWIGRLLRRRKAKHADEPQPIATPKRTERFAAAALVLSLILLVGLVGVGLIAVSAKHDANREKSGKTAAVQALATANSSLVKAGKSPVPTPSEAGPAPVVTRTVTQTPQAGPQGPGPSNQQIQVAVAAYCSAVHCGAGPTAQQVAQAVASYCNAKGECRGAPGQSIVGPSGSAGQNGAAGPAGQNATEAQVAAAVASYCGQPSAPCKGDPGAAGANGQDGASGAPGADGQPPFSWTYTDVLGAQHTCTRDDPFDPSKPTYTCS